MKSIKFDSPGIIHLTKAGEPLPLPCEARLWIHPTGSYGADAHTSHKNLPVHPPRVLGHELVGGLESSGHQVSDEWLGRTRGVQSAWFCGACLEGEQGHQEFCLNCICVDNSHDGGFIEIIQFQDD